MKDMMFYTLNEVADRLKASTKTVRRRIEDGKIPAFKEGGRICVLETDLASYLERLSRRTKTA